MKKGLIFSTVALLGLTALGIQFVRTATPVGSALAQNVPSPLRAIGVDASKANIPLDEILSGGPPPQGIPALGFTGDWNGAAGASPEAKFVSQDEASEWLGDIEPVIAFTANGETKAYPLQVLTWHEIVNDVVGGQPVAVTFCPLCNSALAFDRRLPLTQENQDAIASFNSEASFDSVDAAFNEAYSTQEGGDANLASTLEITLGVSGVLYNSNMIMFDTATSTAFSQLLGRGLVGTLTDTDLLRLPAQIVGFGEFRAAFPDAVVLSRDTGFSRRYGSNPYVGYDDIDSPAFLFRGVADGRLSPKERIVSIEILDESASYPFSVLEQERAVNDSVSGQTVAVFWQEGTASALNEGTIANSKDVGGVGAFSRNLNGQELTFEWNGEAFTDAETGSSWNLLGQATAGELAGSQLEPIVHDNTLWFSWAAFKPDTRIYTGSN